MKEISDRYRGKHDTRLQEMLAKSKTVHVRGRTIEIPRFLSEYFLTHMRAYEAEDIADICRNYDFLSKQEQVPPIIFCRTLLWGIRSLLPIAIEEVRQERTAATAPHSSPDGLRQDPGQRRDDERLETMLTQEEGEGFLKWNPRAVVLDNVYLRDVKHLTTPNYRVLAFSIEDSRANRIPCVLPYKVTWEFEESRSREMESARVILAGNEGTCYDLTASAMGRTVKVGKETVKRGEQLMVTSITQSKGDRQDSEKDPLDTRVQVPRCSPRSPSNAPQPVSV